MWRTWSAEEQIAYDQHKEEQQRKQEQKVAWHHSAQCSDSITSRLILARQDSKPSCAIVWKLRRRSVGHTAEQRMTCKFFCRSFFSGRGNHKAQLRCSPRPRQPWVGQMAFQDLLRVCKTGQMQLDWMKNAWSAVQQPRMLG